MEALTESGWPLGLLLSSSEKKTTEMPGFLIMDNVDLDEKGRVRRSPGHGQESNSPFGNVKSIFSGEVSGTTYRYVYTDDGTLVRNSVSGGYDFNKTIFSGGAAARCRFLPTLGHIFIASGSKKYKDNGTTQAPLGIPKPVAVTGSVDAPRVMGITKDWKGDPLEWTIIEGHSTLVVSNGITVHEDPTTLRGSAQLSQGAESYFQLDDWGGIVGNDINTDLLKFFIKITDPTKLEWMRIEFLNEDSDDPTSVKLAYWHEWDQNAPQFLDDQQTPHPYAAAQLVPDTWTQVSIKRTQLYPGIVDSTQPWRAKAIRFVVKTTEAEVDVGIKDLDFQAGIISEMNDTFDYVCIEVNNTGSYLERSVMSDPFTISASQASITISRASAVDSQANEFWVYRKSSKTGVYYRVNKQTGSPGFTPFDFQDWKSDEQILEEAAIDPSMELEYFRQPLPDNIIGMIWFRDRIIYLTPNAFIPSFKLDPGSYDSRYVYEITGNEAEKCLFITKVDEGTFLVATTRDFYRVTGSFGIISTAEADVLDVNIYPLGVSDPAISEVFLEYESSIMYLSSTGIRALSNSSSYLMNGELELLFKENRYDYLQFNIKQLNDNLDVAVASSGRRIYWSLPTAFGNNGIFVLTLREALSAGGSSGYWRRISGNATCFAKEWDGTILFAGMASASNYLYTMETAAFGNVPVKIQNQFNYGQSAGCRKDSLACKITANTGGHALTLVLKFLMYDGSVVTKNLTLNTASMQTVMYDLKDGDDVPMAYQFTINGTTDVFEMDEFVVIYEARPPLVKRIIQYATNFGKYCRKRIGILPFVADSLGNNIDINVKADGVPLAPQVVSSNDVRTLKWEGDGTAIDWEIELVAQSGAFEFHKWMNPDPIQVFPVPTMKVVVPFSNFGTPSKKKISGWPILIDPRGGTVTIKVRTEGGLRPETLTVTGTGPRTVIWQNETDFFATDWQMEIEGTLPLEFYKAFNPEILQVLPLGKLFDQLGPFDLGRKGLIYGFRLRVMAAASPIVYTVYEDDVEITDGDIVVSTNVDSTYEVTFPKGVDPTVCRVILTSSAEFNRFSMEFKVRPTGRDTEAQFVKLRDKNA